MEYNCAERHQLIERLHFICEMLAFYSNYYEVNAMQSPRVPTINLRNRV